jgi:hypothetical protein
MTVGCCWWVDGRLFAVTRGKMAPAGASRRNWVFLGDVMHQVAEAEVSVRQSADPSTVKVGEAALAGARCCEVDTCVVQVEASILVRDCLHGSPSLSLLG